MSIHIWIKFRRARWFGDGTKDYYARKIITNFYYYEMVLIRFRVVD